jgi:type VI secretion system protein ImpK
MQGPGAAEAVDLSTVHFRVFFSEIERARRTALKATEADAETVAASLSKHLAQVIELQTLEVRRAGGKAGVDIETQARFLKAALADELMLNFDWAGRSAWRHALLEATLFRTSLAGDKVFDDIEQILSAREPAQRRSAMLYLHVLSLGFQGRHRAHGEEAEGAEKLASLRRELFQFVYQRVPDLQGRDRVLAEQAYLSTLSHLKARRLGRLNRWTLVFLLALLLLLGLSELLWLWQSWPVRKMLDGSVAWLQLLTPVLG